MEEKIIYCKNCKNEMIQDDVDFNFKGCYDIYFICQHCGTHLIREIRFSQKHRDIWEYSKPNRQEIIKYKIKR